MRRIKTKEQKVIEKIRKMFPDDSEQFIVDMALDELCSERAMYDDEKEECERDLKELVSNYKP